MSPPERDLVTRGAISSRVRYHVDRERSNFAVDPKVSVLKVASSDSMAPSAINILTPLLVLVLLLILGVEDVEARPPNIMDLILMKLLLCEVAAASCKSADIILSEDKRSVDGGNLQTGRWYSRRLLDAIEIIIGIGGFRGGGGVDFPYSRGGCEGQCVVVGG